MMFKLRGMMDQQEVGEIFFFFFQMVRGIVIFKSLLINFYLKIEVDWEIIMCQVLG